MINESVRQSSIHLNKKLPPGPGRLQDVDPSGPPAMLEVQTQEVPSGNFNKLCLKQLSKQLLAQNPSESRFCSAQFTFSVKAGSGWSFQLSAGR